MNGFGRHSAQVLDSIGNNYRSVSSDNHVAMDCGIMLAIGGFFMIAYIVLLQIKTTSVKLVKLPAGASTSTRPDPLYFKKLGVSVCEPRNPGFAGRADRPFAGPS